MSLPAAETYRAYLAAHAELVETFALTDLDRTGVPVVSASAWGDPSAHGVGYGETPEEAERSALGEAVETLAAARFAARCAPEALTVGEAVARGGIHPDALSPVAGTRVDDLTELLWLPARTWPAGEQRLLPLEAVVTCGAEFALAAPGREPLFPPITNGLGAAPADEPDRAVRHGLMELLQRDVNWSQFKALDTGRAVDARAALPELALPLAAVGIDVRLKYAGQAFGAHVFFAAAADADPDLAPVARTSTGEGADPDPRVAARKAVLELCSSRCRKQFFFGGEEALRVASEEYRRRAEVRTSAAVESGWDLTERFEALLGDPEAVERLVERITHLREEVPLPPAYPAEATPALLAAAGLEVLVCELTEPGEAARVARVTVPGLEAEVLSHHRIGPRALAALRLRLPHTVWDGPAAPGPGWAAAAGAWVDREELRRLAAGFLPLYREPDRHAYVAPAAV